MFVLRVTVSSHECVVLLRVWLCVNMVDMGKEEPPTLTG